MASSSSSSSSSSSQRAKRKERPKTQTKLSETGLDGNGRGSSSSSGRNRTRAEKKSTPLRKAYEQIFTPNATIANRQSLEQVLKTSPDYTFVEDGGNGDVGNEEEDDDAGYMQSMNWSGKNKAEAPKKRRRTQIRGETRPMTVNDIHYDRFKEILICMAFAGINPKFNYLEWITDWSLQNDCSSPHHSLGIKPSMIMPIMDCLIGPLNRFKKVMEELSEIGKPSWPSSQLYMYLREMHITHHIVYSTHIAEHGMQCAINNRPPKANNKLVLFQLKRHKRQRVEIGNASNLDFESEEKTRKRMFLEPFIQDHRFVVSTQYSKILYGYWWLFSLDNLVAKNCADWLRLVRELSADERRSLYPSFSSASDSELAKMFIEDHEEECRKMLKKAVEYVGLIEKQTNAMIKKKPELINKAKQQETEIDD